MSLRRAVVAQLKTSIPALGGRVYQAFLAPVGVQAPYATVKFATERQAANITFAGSQAIEVYLYRALDSYVNLDALRQDVVKFLNGVVIVDAETNARFVIRWVGGAGDVIDPERKLIGAVVNFEAAMLHERR
jgi:hypothetical protein